MADISKIQVNGTDYFVKDETARNSIPTKTSELTNDSGYLTQHQSLANYYDKTEIDGMIGNVESLLASL